MSSLGHVKEWHADDGWGVIESPDTPGGCWAHFTAVLADGYRSLDAGQSVIFEWEAPGQDGFPYRATQIQAEGVDNSF